MGSSQTFYTVVVTNGNTNSAPHDGFIDNLKIEDYYAGSSLASAPSGLTYALCKAKRRGNIRYRDIVAQLSVVANCYIDTNNIVNAGGTAKVEPTTFQFSIIVEHGDASLVTEDETSPGTYLTGAACITRCIARALLNDQVAKKIDVFDPTNATTVGSYGLTTSVTRFGSRIDPAFECGAYETDLTTAEGFVTTTLIDLTMLTH